MGNFKMGDLLAELLAIGNSGRFTAYTAGVPMRLPTGEEVIVKVERTTRSLRPVGLRFSEFAFITEVTAGPHRGRGFGEGATKLVALQKSIAEGVERAIYKATKGTTFGTSTSNGWAAHLTPERAKQSGMEELLERDAVLVHWFCQRPMREIDAATYPAWLARWMDGWMDKELSLGARFKRLRVLVSDAGYLPTITTVFQDSAGFAVMSHATSRSMNEALRKALAETCRIAQIAVEGHYMKSSLALLKTIPGEEPALPEDHAMVYAYHQRFPEWIFGEKQAWRRVGKSWTQAYRALDEAFLGIQFHQITSGPLVVGYCSSTNVQNLFFGRTEQASGRGLLNVHRLTAVKADGGYYPLPHCVP